MRLLGPESAGRGAVGAAAPARFVPLPPGTTLAGRYRIVSALAAGSMGAVYRADDQRAGGRVCAVKELLQVWESENERLEAETWFRREGETLMQLHHPAIPRVHQTFSEGQRHYLVMDFVAGRSLEEVLRQEGRPGLSQERVLSWADQVLEVLSYLHSRGDPLIFRDLKPANLMLTPEDQIRLIDFGIARVFTQQSQGTAIGTPGYAPPEQYQGLAEPASDLYALGATMHHLLTGRDPRKHRPFDFPQVRDINSDVDAAVAAAVDRSLALDPRARHGTAAEMRRALRGKRLADTSQLTISGSLARSHTGSGMLPAPAYRAALLAGADPSGAGLVHVAARSVRVRPDELAISYAGSAPRTDIRHRTIRLKNRGSVRLLCTFDADVPWLRPDRPAAWLEPHSRLELTVGVTWQNPPAGLHRGTIDIQGGGNTWGVPVSVMVRNPNYAVARHVTAPLRRVAMLCFLLGALSMMVSVLGMGDVLPFGVARELTIGGLAGGVILRVLRGGFGG